MPLPNFFVIAPARSGTTTLHRLLDQHPEIYMCPIKETHFFATEVGSRKKAPVGQNCIRRLIAAKAYQARITDIETYSRLFDGVKEEKAIGEACPTYFRSPRAPERMKRYVPEAKFVVVLRNPVDRAFSAYTSRARRHGWSMEGFAEIPHLYTKLGPEEASKRFSFVEGGYHSVYLKRYLEFFDKGVIQVRLFDELIWDIQGALRQIYAFLGVDESFSAEASMRYGATGLPRDWLLHTLLEKSTGSLAFRICLRPLVPGALRRAVSRLRNWNLVKPEIPPDVRRDWMRLYEEDIREVEKLTDMDLSGWLRDSRRQGLKDGPGLTSDGYS